MKSWCRHPLQELMQRLFFVHRLGGLGDDLWAWEPEKHGVYSVGLAYKLLDTRRQQDETDETAGTSGDQS